MREDCQHIGGGRSDPQESAKYPKERRRNHPEPSANPNIAQHLAARLPMISDNEKDRRATTPHARHYKKEQEPFKEKNDHIKAHAVRIRCHTQLIGKNLCPE